MRHLLHYFHWLINLRLHVIIFIVSHWFYYLYIYMSSPYSRMANIHDTFILFYLILCSLIYRSRHQVTSQNVIWTTRVIDLSVLLIVILIPFFVTMCIRIYCFYHKHFSSAIRLLFYCLKYQIRSDTRFATSSLQLTIFSVYSSGVT